MNREEPNLSDNGNRDSVSLTTKPRLPLGVYLTIGIAIILSLAALLIGFLSRVWLGNGTGFARSGSVVVVIGICFAYFNVDQWVQTWVENIAQRSARFRLLRSKLKDWLEHQIVFSEKEIPNTVKRTEIILIILGTLVWGFGDLI
tara:strand:+ start:685 stop:1119 length:435 start_codon:yes stop_codon:yes gene_type:complete